MIRKVAVLGAGVMGASIAAHVANAGTSVVLLDLPSRDGGRNSRVESAVAQLRKQSPSPLMHSGVVERISTGNFDDDLNKLSECDWIIEAVIEELGAKKALYERIESVRRADAIVSSNTSTIPVRDLLEGRSDGFASHFLVTHFFNPPRYLRLLELAAGPSTHQTVTRTIADYGDVSLGKGVVHCKDTPGLIANRVGVMWLLAAMQDALENGLTIEDADAVMGRALGFPKTGVFGLADLVGIDLLPLLLRSIGTNLPSTDAIVRLGQIPPIVSTMIERGQIGRKAGGGFYSKRRDGSGSLRLALDLTTGEYRPRQSPALASVRAAKKGIRALLDHEDEGGKYAWRVMSQVLSYVCDVLPEIADDVHAVDEAMRLGYGWKWGPFEMIDRMGAEYFATRLRSEGRPVPSAIDETLACGTSKSFYHVDHGELHSRQVQRRGHRRVERAAGVLLLSDVKRRSTPLISNRSAALWDIGDGVACLEFTSKMNAIDAGTLELMGRSIKLIPKREYKALVIHNEGTNFSVGANIGELLFAANLAMWQQVEASVMQGQLVMQSLERAPFPVVGAPSGMALGGGCEVLLHCDAVQFHAETYVGLVEVGVGLIPAWGGCRKLLERWQASGAIANGPMPSVMRAFETIALAKVATSAQEAADLGFRRPVDAVSMNRDRVLADAKTRALSLVDGYAPPATSSLTLPGEAGAAALALGLESFASLGRVTTHDMVVSQALAGCLSGRELTNPREAKPDELLTLERHAFMSLLRTPGTLARIEHMLTTNRPLRN